MSRLRAFLALLVLAAAAASTAAAASSSSDPTSSSPRIALDGSADSLRRLLEHHLGLATRLQQARSASSTAAAATAASQDPSTMRSMQQQQQQADETPASSTKPSRRPNFLVIMTDDQDQLLNSTDPEYMPALHKQIATRGLQLRSFTVSTSVCCPSRANFLTGRFAHNNNVTGNISPRGGWAKFRLTKQDQSYLPTWLQSLGYRTYFTGKFLNGFDPSPSKPGRDKCPKGWTTFEPLIKPYVLDYWRTGFTTNCEAFHMNEGEYNTDVLLNKTLTYIGDAAHYPDEPFFIFSAPIAPHEGCAGTSGNRDGDSCANPPIPAPRHADLYPDVKLPQTSNYGVAPPKGTLNWVDSAVRNRGWNLQTMLSMYLARLRSLRAIDEMIDASVMLLDQLGLLDNTYVIFMSDNGFKIGNHGVAKGKMTAYEEDVRVPFYIRGPGIPEGVISDYGATVCDVPATLVDLAGATTPWPVDGTPIPLKTLVGFQPQEFNDSRSWRTAMQGMGQLTQLRDQVPHEMWVWGSDTRLNGRDYRAVRLCTSYLAFGSPSAYRKAAMSDEATFGFRLDGTVPYDDPKQDVRGGVDAPVTCYKYVVWCTGTTELYDLMLDPRETQNRFDDAPKRFIDRLDAYLTVQGFCRGKDCYSPYLVLHSGGRVRSFEEAMSSGLDKLYASLPKFAFKECTLYYYPENELGWLQYNETVDADSWPAGGAVPGAEPLPPSPPPPPTPTHQQPQNTSTSEAAGGDGDGVAMLGTSHEAEQSPSDDGQLTPAQAILLQALLERTPTETAGSAGTWDDLQAALQQQQQSAAAEP